MSYIQTRSDTEIAYASNPVTTYEQETVINNFQDDTEWTKGSQGTMVEDTSDYIRGSQSISLTETSPLEHHIDRAGYNIDFTGKQVVVYVQLNDMVTLAAQSGYARIVLCSDNDTNFANSLAFTFTGMKLNTSQLVDAAGLWHRLIFNWGEGTVVAGTIARNSVKSIRLQFDSNNTSAVAITGFDATTDAFTKNGHALNNGDRIYLTAGAGAIPTNTALNVKYFVVNKATNTFQISTTLGGSAVDLQSTGNCSYIATSGTNIVAKINGICTIPEPSAGVVSLTFDDGWISLYTEAKKKMDSYNFKGTAYVIPNAIDSGASYCSLAQLKTMQEMGWDMCCHYQTNLTTLATTAVESELRSVKEYFVANGLKGFNHFAYPNGAWDKTTVLPIVKKLFASARSVAGNYPESILPADIYKIRVMNIVNTATNANMVTDIATAIDAARTNKEWLILVFHKIVTPDTETTSMTVANFGTVIDDIATDGILVKTISEVLGV